MDKKRLHHTWTYIRMVKVWHLLVLFLVSTTICVVSLRSNNLTMVQLRDEVYTADQADGDVEGALQRLRAFVYGHMNTQLASDDTAVYPPIQLKYTYERLKQAEQDRVKQVNEQVYTDAQNYCERLYPGSFSGGPRVPCIESYVAERGVKEHAIPDALYKFDFVSPTWSPDMAGFSLLASIFFACLLVLRLIAGRFAKKEL
jgi:hypothetical protein